MKKIQTLFVFLLAFVFAYAGAESPSSNYKKITLKTFPYKSLGNIKRAPMISIWVFQRNHKFVFDTSLTNCMVEIIADKNIVYYTFIDENGCIDLPGDLDGEYELRLHVEENVFSASIHL